jgi:Fe-S cluster biogenesis protein NfuA/nitrite reductase/ring-hydroxylating ferredoxin subunit
MAHRPDEPQDNAQWRTAGDRIQTLLDASAAGGAVARERAEQLVCEVTDLYGAAIARMLRTAVAANPELAEAFAADDLVASLLLVHGLHPHGVERRVSDALDSVRPYLGSHGGDVELLEVDGDPDNLTVRLRFSGSCKSCPSSSVTLELAVEDAVRAAAPEIATIEVVAAESDSSSSVIPAESLLARVHANGHSHTAWRPLPDFCDLARGEVGGFDVAGMGVFVCRIGDELFAYRDHCPTCTGSLAGARLVGAVLPCPRCGTNFDVVHAGTGIDCAGHLDPVPLLVRDGVLSMAIPAGQGA